MTPQEYFGEPYHPQSWPWLAWLLPNDMVYLTKEHEYAFVVSPLIPTDRGSVYGTLVLQRYVWEYQPLRPMESWFTSALGRGFDGSTILQPVPSRSRQLRVRSDQEFNPRYVGLQALPGSESYFFVMSRVRELERLNRALNEQLDGYQAGNSLSADGTFVNPAVVAAVNEYTRARITEDGFYRRITPPVELMSNADPLPTEHVTMMFTSPETEAIFWDGLQRATEELLAAPPEEQPNTVLAPTGRRLRGLRTESPTSTTSD